MKTLNIDVTENDIIKSIKNLHYSPIEYAAARSLKEAVDNVEVKHDGIIVWNEDDSDYIKYTYEDSAIKNIILFLEEWEDFKDEKVIEFCSPPFSFVATQQK
jgi:hypothetical protein